MSTPSPSSAIQRFTTLLFASLIVAIVPSTLWAQTIAGGALHTVVVKPDGTVWTFGLNTNGQLGDGTTTQKRVPVQVNGVSSVVAVAAGSVHTLALTSGGNVYAWGGNGSGQLGDGSTTQRNSPVLIGINSVVAIAAGEFHSVALRSNGDVYTWGRNSNGQLALGTTTQANSPTLVLSGVGAAVGAGHTHTLVVKTNGTVWAAGLNANNQLGDGTTTQQTSLVQMSGIAGGNEGHRGTVPFGRPPQRRHTQISWLQRLRTAWRRDVYAALYTCCRERDQRRDCDHRRDEPHDGADVGGQRVRVGIERVWPAR
jgi:hypothetical protein